MPAVRKSSTRVAGIRETCRRGRVPAAGRARPAGARSSGPPQPGPQAAGRPLHRRVGGRCRPGARGRRRRRPPAAPAGPGRADRTAPPADRGAGRAHRRSRASTSDRRPGAHSRPRTPMRSSRTGTTTRSPVRWSPPRPAVMHHRVARHRPGERGDRPFHRQVRQPARPQGADVQRADRGRPHEAEQCGTGDRHQGPGPDQSQHDSSGEQHEPAPRRRAMAAHRSRRTSPAATAAAGAASRESGRSATCPAGALDLVTRHRGAQVRQASPRRCPRPRPARRRS